MILCSGLDNMNVRVCMYVRERERDKVYDTENMQANVLRKEKDSTTLQGGRRVLYIVTLSLH